MVSPPSLSCDVLAVNSGIEAIDIDHDPHNNPYHQMHRQRQLEQQTMNSRLLWKEELRQELESEIDTEKAIQDYYNQLN